MADTKYIRGIRDRIPSLTLIGRTDSGDGNPHVISAAQLRAAFNLASKNDLATATGKVTTVTQNAEFSLGPVPLAATFTAYNITTQTLTDVASAGQGVGALVLKAPFISTANLLAGWYKAVPVAPYRLSVFARLLSDFPDNSNHFKLGWFDSSSKKFEGFTISSLPSGNNGDIVNYTGPSTFSGTQHSGPGDPLANAIGGANLWFALYDDGTNLNFQVSFDGINWLTLFSEAYASSFLGTAYPDFLIGAGNNGNSAGHTLIAVRALDPTGLARTYP